MLFKKLSQLEIVKNQQNISRVDDLLASSLQVWNNHSADEIANLKKLAKTDEQLKVSLKTAQRIAKEKYPLRFYRLPIFLSVLSTGFIVAQSYYFSFSAFSLSIIPIIIWGTIMLVNLSILNKQYLYNKGQKALLVRSIINQQKDKIIN